MSSLRGHTMGDERGFTLVEMLMTMTVGMIVLFAALGASDVFTKTASNADKAAAAQDAARATVRSIVGVLREGRIASGQTTPMPLTWTPSRRDLTVAAYVKPTGSPTSQPGWMRYCAATSGSQSSLIVGMRVGDAYLPPGPCSASDTTNGWQHYIAIKGTLQSPDKLFDFTSSACTGATCLPTGPDVQAVGIRLVVGSSPGAALIYNSTVRDAVSFRNRSSA